MADKLTAAELLSAITKADAEKHPCEQAWISDETAAGLREVTFDGKMDLERIAALINERQGVGQSL
jgi:hypothetical protein